MPKTILVPIGPPGSGKSTLCNGLQQFMTAISRPCSVANLDPANDNIPYNAAFDVREIVSVEEVMEREELGPNGGVLWAMEEVEGSLGWLEERLEECEETIILDCPGQPELTTHHNSLPRILQRLEKVGYRIVILQLLDSVALTRPSLYLSSLLLCLRGMLHLPYAAVNILTKIDNLASLGGANLPFNLDFYTEVQDLTHLLPHLATESSPFPSPPPQKLEALNTALIQLIEDFSLLTFTPLAVEDRQSMAALLRTIDRASGYVFLGAPGIDGEGRTMEGEQSVWAQAMSERWMGRMEVRDVQERWIDRRESFDKMEREGWAEEARAAGVEGFGDGEGGSATVVGAEGGVEEMEIMREGKGGGIGEDELLAEQRRWEESTRGGNGGGGTTRVERKP